MGGPKTAIANVIGLQLSLYASYDVAGYAEKKNGLNLKACRLPP